jgi:hypothetical protein
MKEKVTEVQCVNMFKRLKVFNLSIFPLISNFVLKKSLCLRAFESLCQENVQEVQCVQWVQKVGSIFRFRLLKPLAFFEV